MKFLLPLLRNNILQLSHANQLRYADTKNRTKTITLYMLIAAILMGLLAYLIYSLKIIYSIAWSLEEVVTELVIPMVLICVSLNIAISVFWGSGLLLSDTNIDSMLALPIPLRTLMQSIGMTNQQLRKMMISESFSYVLLAGIVGTLAAGVLGMTLVRAFVDISPSSIMMTFQMTLLPALIMLVLFLVLAFIVPVIALRLFNNRSVVERLRVNE